ncbi:Uncharacterized protein TCAP_05749 [Tolypocladium capitatum]|uniref:Uncharacterized protein n=1 Tax=Tolypocladium capitatum TaxID=45235 RepID=A0A2K3QA02_9HYPO|nr:Uncharacterized protein TCAP_05749 [Tolypocladium capitatum]
MLQLNPSLMQQSPMASLCNRKRPNADHLSQVNPAAKGLEAARRHRGTYFPPSFWDGLPEVSLTPPALRELGRRNRVQRHAPTATAPSGVISIARFARHGGPDLRHLRGFPAPMESTPSSKSSRSRRTQSTTATGVGSKNSMSSAHDKNCRVHLVDDGVYPVGHDHHDDLPGAEPRNWDSVHDQLLVARASLSSSSFFQSAFREFREKNDRAAFESDGMATAVAIICGDRDIPNKQNILFIELEPITNDNAVNPERTRFRQGPCQPDALARYAQDRAR